MTPLVPIMLFGWVPFTIFLFFTLKPHRAVLVSVIGGFLLLPVFSYDFQGIPSYNKNTAIALGLILGGWLSGQRQMADFSWSIYDLPMVMWCFSSIPTSITNQLGLYDGISGTYTALMTWGVPYLAGRIYLKNDEALRDLCWGILIGGMVYALLCLYEIRMSPQLSKTFYGIFPHEWTQHRRYGGWRPIVFMRHGLMTALWMAAVATTAFWLWRSRVVKNIKGVPMGLIVVALLITAILCKAASGWVALSIGCGAYFIYRRGKGNLVFILLLLMVPLYVGMRISGTVPMDEVVTQASRVFDEDRTGSLRWRLMQEELFAERAMERPLFGWGGYSRGWPVDPDTGRRLIRMVDSMWVIIFSSRGFFGITTLFLGMLIGPWLVLRTTAVNKDNARQEAVMMATLLSIVVILFMIDSLFNSMVNTIYIMTTGALVGWHLSTKENLREDGNQRVGRIQRKTPYSKLITKRQPNATH